MSWRRVGLIYLVLSALATLLMVGERSQQASSPDAPPSPGASLLQETEDAITMVTFLRGDSRVTAVREGTRWKIVEPFAAPIPPDLVAATIATLTEGQASEVMLGATSDLSAFGLVQASSAIEVTVAGPPIRQVRVILGARNPTRTAIYAKREDQTKVYLVGLNVGYYQDLIFEAADNAG